MENDKEILVKKYVTFTIDDLQFIKGHIYDVKQYIYEEGYDSYLRRVLYGIRVYVNPNYKRYKFILIHIKWCFIILYLAINDLFDDLVCKPINEAMESIYDIDICNYDEFDDTLIQCMYRIKNPQLFLLMMIFAEATYMYKKYDFYNGIIDYGEYLEYITLKIL